MYLIKLASGQSVGTTLKTVTNADLWIGTGYPKSSCPANLRQESGMSTAHGWGIKTSSRVILQLSIYLTQQSRQWSQINTSGKADVKMVSRSTKWVRLTSYKKQEPGLMHHQPYQQLCFTILTLVCKSLVGPKCHTRYEHSNLTSCWTLMLKSKGELFIYDDCRTFTDDCHLISFTSLNQLSTPK